MLLNMKIIIIDDILILNQEKTIQEKIDLQFSSYCYETCRLHYRPKQLAVLENAQLV